MKRCSECGREFPATTQYFHQNKSHKDGLRGNCKACALKYNRKWQEKNCKKLHVYYRQYYEKNKERESSRQKQYRGENLEKCRETHRNWRAENPDYYRKYVKEYRAKNPWARISHSISRGISHSISGAKNGGHWESLVNYTRDDLMAHLESQFTKGMTWENYGEWHIDHIRPISSFIFGSIEDEDFKKCWSLENLQPLWAHDNLRKWAKYEKGVDVNLQSTPQQTGQVANKNESENLADRYSSGYLHGNPALSRNVSNTHDGKQVDTRG